jgi:hypothetical protein
MPKAPSKRNTTCGVQGWHVQDTETRPQAGVRWPQHLPLTLDKQTLGDFSSPLCAVTVSNLCLPRSLQTPCPEQGILTVTQKHRKDGK